MKSRLNVSAIGICALTLLAAAPKSRESLESRVETLLKTPPYANGHWGLLVLDAKTGETIFEKNPDRMFCPASVTKLFTTAAALSELGADHRFETPVLARGELKSDGTLEGDLILVASGDLALGGRTGEDGTLRFTDDDHTYANGNPYSRILENDPLAGLDHLAREVAAFGVKAVKGEVIVDDRLFDLAESSGSGPVRVSPIVVNDNLIDVLATPAATVGDPATVRLAPETSHVSADVRVETTDAEGSPVLTITRAGPRRLTVRGRIPIGHKPVLRILEVEDPASFARTLFIEALRRRGVRVEASSLTDNPAARLPSEEARSGLKRVGVYTSPPLREYIKVILKVSHNLHASTLPLILAAKGGGRTLAEGLKREGELLKALGVDPKSVSFGGGAGGDRADLVTPGATVTLLKAMKERPDFLAFDAALPVLGRDGTLARVVTAESPARGHARAKTGTYWVENQLDGNALLVSKAMAGYMETATGRPLIFAFFVNTVPLEASGDKVAEATAAAGRWLGKLCEVFYQDGDPIPTPNSR